ncbi:hypothetical protein QBC44DRAFT_157477 [Cladorrhinum sp. PSN332]|nr:hypothetical protein QBC44DRAFT_157477 [Cladorrhinum sp. PSN332]
MLPRSPFKSRKSAPPKKADEQEEYQGSYFHHDDDDDEMDTLTKIKTWRPPKGLMKRSKPSIDIRRSEDLHKIICMPPSPYTPQSSTSSLCSIENNGAGYGTSPRSSPPRRPDRSPLEPSPQRSPQRSPLLFPQQIEETQNLQPRGRSPVSVYYYPPQLTPPSSPPQHAEMFPEPSAIHHEALPDTPSPAPASASSAATSNEATPLEPAAEITPSSKGLASPDVQKLIQETEEAFKELPTFAKLSEPQLAKFPLPKQPAPLSPLARRKSSRRSQGSVRSSKSVRSVKSPTKAGVTKLPLSPAQPRLPANGRPAVRPKRVKSKKARRRPAAPARQSSMWQLNALTESAKEFAIQIGLHKVQVDEMLPESTLREIRMSRAAQWTKSPELGVTHGDNRKDSTATTVTTTTPIEPLSLDEVATAEGVATPRASLANKAAEIGRDDTKTPKAQGIQLQIPEQKDGKESEERGQSPVPQPDSPTAGRRSDDDDGEDSLPIMMTAEDDLPPPRAMSMGPPPAASASKPPMHRRFPSAPLPTIPEITATAPTTPINPPQTAAPPAPPRPVPVRPGSDEYVFLESTAYTVTVPTFKHGPIRLAKADLPIGKLAAAVDDTLDWTAFQMAIIGGAGDFFSEPTDYSRQSEAELDDLDEIYTWFRSFGFESAGGLVSARQRPAKKVVSSPPPPRTPGLSPSASSVSSSGSPPAPAPQRSPGMMVRIDPPPARSEPDHLDSLAGRVLAPPPAHKTHRRSVSSGTFSMGQGQPFDSNNNKNHKNLAIDSVKSQQQLRRPSTDSMMSLPQSPMMELVLTHDVHGEEVPVPMGCNMSHDARDFLFWHTEHVISYGSSPSGESRAELI